MTSPSGSRRRHGSWTRSVSGFDRIIPGSIVQIPLERSDLVVAEFGDLAAVRLTVADLGPQRQTQREQ